MWQGANKMEFSLNAGGTLELARPSSWIVMERDFWFLKNVTGFTEMWLYVMDVLFQGF